MNTSMTVRVVAIRSQNPTGFGGAIFTGKQIDARGDVLDAGAYVVVRAASGVVGGATLERGQWWSVSGDAVIKVTEVNGYSIREHQVEATSAALVRPSGEHVVAYIADTQAFEGIGLVKARKLWEAFGDRLYEHLDSGDVESLATVLPIGLAEKAVVAWTACGDSQTLQWLQSSGFDQKIGRKVMTFFGRDTALRVEEDPYRLLSFCATWPTVDAMAQTQFGVARDDERRLQGAVEEAGYRLFAAGHTLASPNALVEKLRDILGAQKPGCEWRDLVPRALAKGASNGSYVVTTHGIQPLGALVMEREVAKVVAERLQPTSGSALLSAECVDEILKQAELADAIEFNEEQRRAVQMATSERVALIMGGAGVGKTTVLKAVYKIYDLAGVSVTQLALAGRAAKRMQEATGRQARTIAHFLHTFKEGQLEGDCAVVVDEASMVDIITMSQLCRVLPAHARLLLVGDPAQLMPVGPGLVLHAISRVAQVPRVELVVVRRHGSEIADAAAAVRDGQWPAIGRSEMAPIVFVPAGGIGGAEEIDSAVLRLYEQDPRETQILCARKSGRDGIEHLNELCQRAMTAKRPPVLVWNREHEQTAGTGLNVGDLVLCTRNFWDRGLQNGSLGAVVEGMPRPHSADGDEDPIVAWVDWDDSIKRPLTESMLEDVMLGYAITVHKAQGSQWPRVIVPLTKNRLLDRTLIYTAMTRARRQVVLVGDEQAARMAVQAQPQVDKRQVALDRVLVDLLHLESGETAIG